MLIGLSIILALLVLAAVVLVVATPLPVVWMMRHAGAGESHAGLPVDEERRCRETVIVKRDLPYPSKDGRNRYDLYLPRDANGAVPVVVWIHGGAFIAGDKSGTEPWGMMLAAHGYAVAAVDYQWAPEISYPGQARQVQECLTELRCAADGGRPSLDMSRVVLAGDSAGAFLAAQAALILSCPAYANEVGVAPALAPADVCATLLFCGPYDVQEILKVEDARLRFLVHRLGWALMGKRNWRGDDALATTVIKDFATAAFPPSFISDGNNFSFEREGQELARALADKGARVETLFFPKDEGKTVDHEYQMGLNTHEGGLAWERVTRFLSSLGLP